MPPPKEITHEEWQRIVAVFSKHEGRVRAAAAELGWPRARAIRRYRLGYPSLGYPPIKTILARDLFSADEIRAERQLAEARLPPSAPSHAAVEVITSAEQARLKQLVRREEDRQLARNDAIKARGEEATLIQINRRNAIALNAMTAQVLRGAAALSATIQAELEQEAKSSKMSLPQKLHLVRSAASIARFNAEASVMAVKAERLVLGSPIEAAGDGPDERGSLDEAAAWIEKCATALKRARSRGLLAADGRQDGS
jgi:hypothetical protein